MHKLHYRLTVSAFIEHTFCTAKIQKIIGRTFRQAVYLQNFAHFRHIVQPKCEYFTLFLTKSIEWE